MRGHNAVQLHENITPQNLLPTKNFFSEMYEILYTQNYLCLQYRHVNTEIHGKTDIQTNKHTDKQTHRQTDKQTNILSR